MLQRPVLREPVSEQSRETLLIAMFLSSRDPMYDAAMFSYNGDFLDYLGLEGMGIFTTNDYDPGVPEEKLEELRRFGETL